MPDKANPKFSYSYWQFYLYKKLMSMATENTNEIAIIDNGYKATIIEAKPMVG